MTFTHNGLLAAHWKCRAGAMKIQETGWKAASTNESVVAKPTIKSKTNGSRGGEL